jgi:hypothetical protein
MTNRVARFLVHCTITLVGFLVFAGAVLTSTAGTAGSADGYVGREHIAPAAILNTAQIDDLRTTPLPATITEPSLDGDTDGEGQDVYYLVPRDAAAGLVGALASQRPQWWSAAAEYDETHHGAYLVPVGTVVTVEGYGVYTFELDEMIFDPRGAIHVPGHLAAPTSAHSKAPHSKAMPTRHPRRSPHGARVLPRSRWLDNSPVYRDGYVWLVDDMKHTTSWRRLAEDGSLVSPHFYDHATKTGATQARCDVLGKVRVSGPVYGHRCIARPTSDSKAPHSKAQKNLAQMA